MAKVKGFSLIELVIVIVLLGVLSISVATIFTDTTENYLQSEARLSMASTARLAIERIGREVREAMPNSVRVNADNSCVEFVPIMAATEYVTLPTTSPGTTIDVVEPDASTEISGLSTTELYAMVIPLNNQEVYNPSTSHASSVSGFAKQGGNITRATIASARFNRRSPRDRIFFVSQPVSFCLVGNQLNRYSSYGFNNSQPAPASMGTPSLILNRLLLDDNGTPVEVFEYDSGTLSRSGILMIELLLEGRKESINLQHEVHIRNFP